VSWSLGGYLIMPRFNLRCAVVALGGNAISPTGEPSSVIEQFSHTRSSLKGIIRLLEQGYNMAITHGNGPQVGDKLLRVELTREQLPDIPLGVLVADTQGSMGYMIEQSLQNFLTREKLNRQVVTIITQVLVDEHDPAFTDPTKFIGQYYSKEEAETLSKDNGWTVKQYKDDKWRRVVGSPRPLSIVNRRAIRELVQRGIVLIASGGGGIPVCRDTSTILNGVDAVIDKDRSGAVMAHDIEAEEFIIVTNVDTVKINYGKPNERPIHRMRIREAKEYIAEGHFPAGSMGEKVEAAVQFVERGGERAIICALEDMEEALKGNAGTLILP